MASMIDDLVNSFGGPVLEDLAKRVGIPSEMVKSAMPMITGLVVSGIGRLSKQAGGLDQITSLLTNASEKVGTDLDAYVKDVDPTKSADMLKSLFGSNSVENIANNVAKKTGLSADSIMQLVGVAAPGLMASIGKMAKDNGIDSAGIAKLIDDNADALKGLGDLDNLLDNVPGFTDDIKRGFNKIFGGS